MKFTHVIEITNPLIPLAQPLNRDQLWRGLVLRAENPKLFVPWLDAFTILERTDQSLSRELQYGQLRVRDEVRLLAPSQLWFRVPAQGDLPLSQLVISIEEPEAGVVAVRFEYASEAPAHSTPEEEVFEKYRRSAYVEIDVESIRLIRQMAADGRLA